MSCLSGIGVVIGLFAQLIITLIMLPINIVVLVVTWIFFIIGYCVGLLCCRQRMSEINQNFQESQLEAQQYRIQEYQAQSDPSDDPKLTPTSIDQMFPARTLQEIIQNEESKQSLQPDHEQVLHDDNATGDISAENLEKQEATQDESSVSNSHIKVKYLNLSCAICQSAIENNQTKLVRKLTCGHMFHDHCIWQWMTLTSATCPICSQKYA